MGVTRAEFRQVNQAKRIDEGVASGKLTKVETAIVKTTQKAIDTTIDAFTSKGKMTKGQRRAVEKLQDAQSALIKTLKNNNATTASTPVLDKRAANLQGRVDQGVASGQLNTRESTRLQARVDGLNANKTAAKADGVVSGDEREGIRNQAQRISQGVARQKHDAQKA
jgi:hypothetical protein